ncbi:haloacid dehalogenase-like hydrolase [Desulfomicrobium norvegicum]|uniref:haloacid dehalogenase-like hydrolase n=1 Tax=Desulfomicrobium norvegicum (strain DSM 1741 / NCIMB 8310) TaxID=52561 RepID=UPI000B8066BF
MQPDPELATAMARLRAAGWEVVVASAGCDWYIRRILAEAGVKVEVHANPGVHVLPEGSLRMNFPEDSPFQCLETGVDKASIVRLHRDGGARVAFAGDGFADLPITHEDNLAAAQVHHEGQILVTFADVDLVNDDALKAGQFRFGKSSVQMLLEDIFDNKKSDCQPDPADHRTRCSMKSRVGLLQCRVKRSETCRIRRTPTTAPIPALPWACLTGPSRN